MAVVPCIDFKIAMNHRWLFSGPTMLHIISLHFTPSVVVFVLHRCLIESLVPSSLVVKQSCLSAFVDILFLEQLVVIFCANTGKKQFPALRETLSVL